MNVSELLRALADKLDSIHHDTGHVEPESHGAELTPVDVDNTDHTEDSLFVAPLQQKLELLKKAAGVESIYDEPCEVCGQSPCQCAHGEDEMDIMKRNAGLPVTIHVAAEDNDILEDKR